MKNSRSRLLLLLVGVLAIASTASSLRNGFAYDDVLIVETNAHVHTLASPLAYLHQSYWPAESGPAGYRPLTIYALAIQWWMGHGSPTIFHATNVLLHVAVTWVFLLLCLELIPIGPAGIAAAVYAVHPIHSEAVGNVVGQGEEWMALITSVAVLVYLRGRARGRLSWRTQAIVIGCAVLAPLAKEQGLMLLGVLVAAECTVVTDSRPLATRFRELRPLGLWLIMATGLVGLQRDSVVHGLASGPPASVFRDVGFLERLRVMLGIVPQWGRLLVWPERLLSVYSPPAFGGEPGFGGPQMLGVALLFCGAAVFAVTWRRRPVIAFGISWAAISLLPVANILFPSGFLIAERTFYLPTAGVFIAFGAGIDWIATRLADRRRRGLLVLASIAMAALIIIGAVRSSSRMWVWKNSGTLFATTVKDSPNSFMAHWDYGRYLAMSGRERQGLNEMRIADSLISDHPRLVEELSLWVRKLDGCEAALPYFRREVQLEGEWPVGRSRLVFCLLELGRAEEASAVAHEGVARGLPAFAPLAKRADSLLQRPQ